MVNSATKINENKNLPKTGESALKQTVRRLIKNKSAMLGLCVVLILALLAIFAEYIIPYDYTAMNMLDANKSPSWEHLFGTDDLGRDIFSRVIYGGRYSLRLGISAVIVSMLVGIVLGTLAGYFGGTVDQIIMRLLDVQSAIPGMLLSIVVSAVLGPGFNNTIVALAIGGIPGYTRLLRAQILSVRDQEYLEAARSINCSNIRIMARQILPNTLSPLIVNATMQCATTLLAAAALSYIGLGVQPPEPEWGAMLSGARSYIRLYPYQLIFPGVFIMITVIALNTFGDGLRDAMDPKLKK